MGFSATLERPEILDAVEQNGFAVFDGLYDLNLIGLRTLSNVSNTFDDWFYIVCRGEDGLWHQWVFPCTTDAGLYWLQNPSRVEGTAIMVDPQQARGVYKLDLHHGSYLALCQRNGTVRVWRDGNKDEILDRGGEEYTGWYGINIHRASAHRTINNVERYSAGCTVIQNPSDFDILIELCKKQVEFLGIDTFTYTLIKESRG